MTAPAFLPADLIFCHGDSWLAGAIRWASRGRGEAGTYANHVAGLVGGDSVVEALWTTVKHPYREISDPHQVWRCSSLTDIDRVRIATEARGYVGKRYGGAKILTHLGDALLSKAFGGNPFFFRHLAHRQDYPICSWVWAYAFAEADYLFGLPPEAAQPDDMHDWCLSHPDHWTMIHEVAA